MRAVETKEDVDALFNEYIESKLKAKSISDEDLVRSLDYYVSRTFTYHQGRDIFTGG